MTYFMPTKIFEDEGVVSKSLALLKGLGSSALIVTGRHSAKLCGALDDVVAVLERGGISYCIFDKVSANPLISQNFDGAIFGKGVDFVIAIGGGSPLDTAKGIAVLLKHGTDDYEEKLFGAKDYDALPVVAIPTTAGTGSETTPYSVFTDEEQGTKRSMARRVFPIYSLIDPRYFMTMSQKLRNTTMMDALSHAIESFLSVKSTPYSELFALETIALIGKHKDKAFDETVSLEVMTELIHASTFAGFAISQTGTTLPHSFGYPITYDYHVEHGFANVMFMQDYLQICAQDRVARVLDALGFASTQEFGVYIDRLLSESLEPMVVRENHIERYVHMLMANKVKLANHPGGLSEDQARHMYQRVFAKF